MINMDILALFGYFQINGKSKKRVHPTNDTSNLGQMLCQTSGMSESWTDP